MNNLKYREKQWLYQEYWVNKKSIHGLAKMCNCGDSTIFTWMKKHKIKTRNKTESNKNRHDRKQTLYKKEFWLRTEYVVKKKSALKIAEKIGCSDGTILYWMAKFNIPLRSQSNLKGKKASDETKKRISEAKKAYYKKIVTFYKDRNWLYDQYIVNHQSSGQIAEKREYINRNRLKGYIYG